MYKGRNRHGFTLIELLITIVIAGILGAIAYPSYVQYTVKTKRSAAESFILDVASRQEQYNLDARQYATTMTVLGATSIPPEVSSNYTVALSADNSATPPTYTVTATPTASQLSRDTKCATLTVNQSGTKGISGSGTVATCW
jgi:type IV pilus assembly protein PilE